MINILILAAICLFARRSIGRSEVYRLLFLLALANIVFMAVPESGQILKRLSVFLSFAPIVILAGMTDMFKGAKTKVVMRILLICYGVLFFVFSYYILGQAEIIPYQSIWGSMNTVGFMIMAHNNFEQLNVFIGQLLEYPGSYVYIFVDGKARIFIKI